MRDGESGQEGCSSKCPFMETPSQGNGDFLITIESILICDSIFLHVVIVVIFFSSVLLTRGQPSEGQDKLIFLSSLYPQNLVQCLAHGECSINLSYTLELLWKSFPWVNCEQN